MDERRSVTLLGWTIGGIVGVMFVLNAVALALVQNGSPPRSVLASQAVTPLAATISAAPRTKADRS